MNLPNKLTLFRIFLIPVFILVMLFNIPSKYLIACVIFIVASITDAMDGHIARKHNLITDFGKFMDPLAFNVMQGKLKAEANDIKSKNMSSAFYQREIKVVGKNVLGFGELVSMMSGQTIGTQNIGYKMVFDYRSGKLFVKSFERVKMPDTGISGYEEMLKQQAAQPMPPAQ